MKIKTGSAHGAGTRLRLLKVGLCTAGLCFAGSFGTLLAVKLAQTDTLLPGSGTLGPPGKSRPYDTRHLVGDMRTLEALVRYVLEPEPEGGTTMILTSVKPAAVRTEWRFAPQQPPILLSNRPKLRFDRFYPQFDPATNVPTSS
jgi:hypothetical protein